MNRTQREPHRHLGRCRPLVERLEQHLALSASAVSDPFQAALSVWSSSAFERTADEELGPNLSPVTTDPAPGSTIGRAPVSIAVTFDRPLDPFSLLADDVLIQRLGDDGAWDLAHDAVSPPGEALDPTGRQLLLSPLNPLTSGHYRLVLPRFSTLTGEDGSFLADLGADQVLGEFTIDRPGVKLSDATGLGQLGPNPVIVAGRLDLAGDPGDVRLYRLEVPSGHHWRFGAEVAAQREGSPLLSTLSLFDANGRLLTTSAHGRPDAPADPFLFAGLAPGTYYLGISGAGNLAGRSGYDPISGRRGTVDFLQTGGSYRLTLVADPADVPTRLLGFSLNWADPLRNVPTGFSLTFSGLLSNDSFRGDPSPGFHVVGPDGQVVPATAVGYHEAGAQYYFLFNRALTPGRYTIVIPNQGGATDLAGLTPVAPGEPDGVLARFEVSASPIGNRDPRDLGPLYEDAITGLTFNEIVLPGAAVTNRLVITAEGHYRLGTRGTEASAGALSVRLLGPEGLQSLDATPPGPPEFYLRPGVYFVQFVNGGPRPIHFAWTITQKTLWDSLLDNGVGQGPALAQRLVNPTTAGSLTSQSLTGQGPQTPPIPNGQVGPLGTSGVGTLAAGLGASSGTPTTSFGTTATAAPAGLFLTVGNTAVGRPSTSTEHVAAVGSSSASGTTALAYGQDGLPQGITIGRNSGRRTASKRSVPDERDPDRGGSGLDLPAIHPIDGAMVAAPAQVDAMSDELVIAAADWITRFGSAASRMFSAGSDVEPEMEAEGADSPSQVRQIAMTPDGHLVGEGRVQAAHFETPLVVGMASVLAMRYHQPFRRWIDRRRSPSAVSQTKPLKGPHWKI